MNCSFDYVATTFERLSYSFCITNP